MLFFWIEQPLAGLMHMGYWEEVRRSAGQHNLSTSKKNSAAKYYLGAEKIDDARSKSN
jgi:hypothetical protein